MVNTQMTETNFRLIQDFSAL